MPSRKVLAQIVCESRNIWSAMTASTASRAASKQASKSTPAPPPAPAPAAAAPATETPTTTKTKTTTPKVKVKSGHKLQPVSPALKHFLGGVEWTTRPNTVKLVWDYIREHQLQDPADKKNVNCDEKLKTVLGKDRVNFTEIAGLISPHFPKRDGKRSCNQDVAKQ